ncbi:MAG: radical activating enzyme [Actinomycetia bacterium]|nr:radical activating enzyme [Actinomycetes bacterium]
MALDTWDTGGGAEVALDTLTRQWRDALDAGADGITISGGEPLAQATALTAFLGDIDRVRRETAQRTGGEYDILLYTGYDPSDLDDSQIAAARRADVLVTGRYQAKAPTGLIWRGSANQVMHLHTDLARRRYAEYVDFTPEQPPIQIRADPDGFWLVGVPRKGTLSALERGLRRGGMDLNWTSWRLQRRS